MPVKFRHTSLRFWFFLSYLITTVPKLIRRHDLTIQLPLVLVVGEVVVATAPTLMVASLQSLFVCIGCPPWPPVATVFKARGLSTLLFLTKDI